MQNGSSGSEPGGNTIPPASQKKRVNASKNWCFTWHDYSETELGSMAPVAQGLGMEYVFGRETCPDTGRPHIQGCVFSDTKFRPMEKLKWNKTIHWECCKGDKLSNIQYCIKDKNFETNIDLDKYLPEEIDYEEPYGWQLQVVDIIKEKPCKRTIHWFWEPTGGYGKSELCRYLALKHDALMCAGKASDMKYMVSQYQEKNKRSPKIIIFDVPRDSFEYISYTGIEEVKNAVFASPKYESKMYVGNRPHVIIFANFPPDTSSSARMSVDRYNIVNISNTPDTLSIDHMITGGYQA